MRSALLCLCLLSLLPTVAPAVTVGGNPAHLVHYPDPDLDVEDATIAIAQSGTIFVCFARSEFVESEIVLMKSEDDGATWTEWGVIGDLENDRFERPQMKIAQGPFDERVYVAYVDADLYAVKLSYASTSDVVPVWATHTPINPSGTTWIEDIAMDVRPHPTQLVAVAVAAATSAFHQDEEVEWYYSVSDNAGSSFGAQQLVHSASGSLIDGSRGGEVGLAFGDGNRVYLSVLEAVHGFDQPESSHLYFYDNTGLGVGAWPASGTEIFSNDYTAEHLSMSADQDGDGVCIALSDSDYSDDNELLVLYSNDEGTTWYTPYVGEYSTVDGTFATWNADGPRVIADVFREVRAFRPNLGFTTTLWNSGVWLSGSVPYGQMAGFAEDPNSPGRYAMAAVYYPTYNQEPGIWFEATWRDDTGYGVNHDDDVQTSRGTFNSAPAIGDLDGDGYKSIVLTSRDSGGQNRLEVFDYSSAHESRRSVDIVASSSASAPALYDIEGDGDLEIFMGSPRGAVAAFDHDLNPLEGWPVLFHDTGNTWVSVGPVTGFAEAEVVAVNGSRVHVLNAIGLEMPGWPWSPTSGEAVGRAAIGDVDGDGTAEVVVAFTSGVAVLNHDGTVQQLLLGPHVPSTGVTLVDLDEDGDLEIAGPMEDGFVLLVHHDGGTYDPAFPYDSLSGRPVSAVTIANVEEAGRPALCFTSGQSVFAVEPDGTLLSGYPIDIGRDISTEPIIGRVARPNTSRPQLLFGTFDGWVHMRTAVAETPRDWPHFYEEDKALPPAIADLDGDGFHDLVLPVGEALWVLDSGTEGLQSRKRRWPMAGHDRARSSCSGCRLGTPTAVEPLEPTSIFSFAGAFPNPSSGRTNFRFSLPAGSDVELTVYDLRGRRVRTLVAGNRSAGAYDEQWDGRDHAGRSVAAGTYFGRLVVTRGALKQVKVRELAIVR